MAHSLRQKCLLTFMPCWNREFLRVLQMIKSAHWTTTIDTKNAVWHVNSNILRSRYVHSCPYESSRSFKALESHSLLKPIWKLKKHLYVQWARKFKKVQAKKLVKSNKSISRIIFFDQIPFFEISKMAKNQFLNWE